MTFYENCNFTIADFTFSLFKFTIQLTVNIFFTKKHKTPLLLVTHRTYVVALSGTELICPTYQADENKVFFS